MESSSKTNDDDDVNDYNKGKKKRFISKTTALHHTLWYFFLPRLALHDFYLRLRFMEDVNTRRNIFLSLQPFRIQLQDSSPLFVKLKPVKPFQSTLNTSQIGKLAIRPKRFEISNLHQQIGKNVLNRTHLICWLFSSKPTTQ